VPKNALRSSGAWSSAGDDAEAERRTLQCVEAYRHLGIVLQGLGRLAEAANAYREALRRRADLISCNNLGIVLQQTGDDDGALAVQIQAVRLWPECAEAHNNLGTSLRRAGRHEDAMAAYRRALELRPTYADAHLNVGIALQEAGRTREARAEVEQAIVDSPAHAQAWYLLSDLKTFTPDDPDIARLEALQREDRPANERSHLAFALGKALMDCGAPDLAFKNLEIGNRIKRSTFSYSVEADTAQMSRIAETFGTECLRRFGGAGVASDLPVFILGMPRSGTSLVEQILASHPAVAGAGELPVLSEVVGHGFVPEDWRTLDEARIRTGLRDMGEHYLRRMAPLGAGRRRLTDKSMGIFRYAGLIHLMLPGARFIHCRRDPVDTCFSCYTKNFSGEQFFAYDLHELGTFHRAHAELMAHWHNVMPAECVLAVDYEALVDDLEGQARRLVAFCGLEWDAACLDFHRTQRRVATASVNQVRRPIYRSSVGRWQAYERHLGPLLAALGPR